MGTTVERIYSLYQVNSSGLLERLVAFFIDAKICFLSSALLAMGLVAGDQLFTHEGAIGSTLKARVLSRETSDETPTVVPMVEGSAWTTGRHEFELDERDPLKDGFSA